VFAKLVAQARQRFDRISTRHQSDPSVL
jgi:hypothetical protein